MRYLFILLLALSLSVSAQKQNELVDYVCPLAGTEASRWFFFNAATRPFGMVNLSPDTRTGADWNGGYLYGDNKIQCFSQVKFNNLTFSFNSQTAHIGENSFCKFQLHIQVLYQNSTIQSSKI